MRYLDQLKQQSQSLNQQDKAPDSEVKAQKIVQELQPALRELLRYLEEFSKVLNEVKPKLSVAYDIEGYGELAGLQQTSYQVQVDNREVIHQITFSFECLDQNPNPKVFEVESREAYLRQREYFWGNNLRFKDKFTMDGHGKFFLEPRVKVQFLFSPDTKQAKIKLEIRNFQAIGRTQRWIAPHNITENSLDHDLGGLILRKINDLDQLSTGQMTAEMRQEIKEKVRRVQEDQKQQDALVAAEKEKEQHEVSLVNRLRRNLNALVRKI